jgi:hypothetical protein
LSPSLIKAAASAAVILANAIFLYFYDFITYFQKTICPSPLRLKENASKKEQNGLVFF